jgi:hypothetical protein
MNYLLWIALISLLVWMLLKMNDLFTDCPEQHQVNELMRKIDRDLENCCDCQADMNQEELVSIEDSIPKPPSENCRAFFSGRLVTDDQNYAESVIFEPNNECEYVGSGFYPIAAEAFPNSHRHTFDGIAVVAGTRIIIYSEKKFQGRVLLDVKGPAIINNVRWKNDYNLSRIIDEINTKNLRGNLNTIFPKECRRYSDSDMHPWSNGSLKIMCDE